MVQAIIDFYVNNVIVGILGTITIVFMIYRMYKTSRMYLGLKSYVKSLKKSRKRKYNGVELVQKIKRKRKRHTNSFAKLYGGAKRKVRKYFEYKKEELPVITKYSFGHLFKRSKEEVIIYIKRGKKTLSKIKMKRPVKAWIEASNEYECLNELIEFLHYLPDAILDKQEYEVVGSTTDITINYQIKIG